MYAIEKLNKRLAIASAISLVITQGLQWEYLLSVVVTASIAISSIQGGRLKLGIQRLTGTVDNLFYGSR
ncbi:hypothetical protein A6770_21295 [Nostoc minutum NIES-26]|uniref:Uncharacterized protein n=1 Tax=Nostoc minutum NIES-26 TaxID=1844469 RepID=A0A367R292_9NOSO|nr:hypothetical protein A6770_21295 [Nostoc minutum NIES-26]